LIFSKHFLVLGIWDFDEYFIPRGKNKNILDVLKKMEYSPQGNLPNMHQLGIKSIYAYMHIHAYTVFIPDF
jgi:hypothetical protein